MFKARVGIMARPEDGASIIELVDLEDRVEMGTPRAKRSTIGASYWVFLMGQSEI